MGISNGDDDSADAGGSWEVGLDDVFGICEKVENCGWWCWQCGVAFDAIVATVPGPETLVSEKNSGELCFSLCCCCCFWLLCIANSAIFMCGEFRRIGVWVRGVKIIFSVDGVLLSGNGFLSCDRYSLSWILKLDEVLFGSVISLVNW